MRQHVLDANAILRFLMSQPGHEIVTRVLQDSSENRMPVLVSAVNWGEAWYSLAKQLGVAETEKLLSPLPETIGLVIVPVDGAAAMRAARLKNRFQLPYADAFAAELTSTQNVLVTADVKDFQRVPKIRLLKLPPKRAN